MNDVELKFELNNAITFYQAILDRNDSMSEEQLVYMVSLLTKCSKYIDDNPKCSSWYRQKKKKLEKIKKKILYKK